MKLEKLMLQYKKQKQEFKKKLKSEVGKQLTEMQEKLEEYKKEAKQLKKARECVTEAFNQIDVLLKEKNEYLRVLYVSVPKH